MSLELVSGVALWGSAPWSGFRYNGAGVLQFPESLRLEKNDFDVRHEEKVRALAHGAAVYGEEIQARDIVVEGDVLHHGDTDAHIHYLDMLRAACAQPDLQLRYRSEFYIRLAKLKGFDHEWFTLSGRTLSKIRITWRAADPFWYASAQSTVTQAMGGNGTVVVNPATGTWPARAEIWPTITITAPSSGSVPRVLLRNESDEGMQFVYEDLQLKNGASVVLNCDRGTVERGGQNAIRYYDGAFTRLLPRENRLTYEGAACTLTIQYRARWI